MSIINEMQDYYSERAEEYDEWYDRKNFYDKGKELNEIWFKELELLATKVGEIQGRKILELASGTGMWTQHLIKNNKVTPTDYSKEMLDKLHERCGVKGKVIDNYHIELEETKEFDLCFFSFWLSHVPPEKEHSFFTELKRVLNKGCELYIVDSFLNKNELNCLTQKENIQLRPLKSGKTFRVYKKYHDKSSLTSTLGPYLSNITVEYLPNYFFIARGTLK